MQLGRLRRGLSGKNVDALGDSLLTHSQVSVDVKEYAVLAQMSSAGISGPRKESLEELRRLVVSAGAKVVGACVQHRGKPRPSMLIGQGKLNELGETCRKYSADLVVFDNDLTPAQMANLDIALGVKVIDRTELILQVFAHRARTREAKVQVEMAQLQYLMPRLAVTNKRMSRQRGGIGMRGPGETPLEMRARNVRSRIKHLKETLRRIAVQRETQIQQRRDLPAVTLVGYTNVGKSTLLNVLTDANVYVDDRLFATLDTTARSVDLPGGQQVIISDTVGFIRGLPHHLIASFRSTLAEVGRANVIVHLADANQDGVHRHIEIVEETLREIGAEQVPRILVFNKIDLLPGSRLPDELRRAYPGSPAISAFQKLSLADLLSEVEAYLND